MSDTSRLSTALLFSMLLHVALLLLLNGQQLLQAPVPAIPDLLTVDLVEMPAPPPAPPQQVARAEAPPPPAVLPESRIVPVPEAGLEIPSEDARFLSDRDNVVEQETVRRGRSLDAAGQDEPGQRELPQPEPAEAEAAPVPPVAEPEPAPAPPAPQPVAEAEAPAPADTASAARPEPAARARPGIGAGEPSSGRDVPGDLALADLLPRPGDIAVAEAARAAAEPAESEATERRRELLPRRRVRFSSGSGIATLLPSVRDGDVTLLNTKAHEFAPFVRRVAVRVFQHLEIALVEAARRGAAGAGQEHAVVRATMRSDGRFVSAVLRESHTETRLSVPRLLLGVIGPRTFFDQNPPPGAVAGDGDIHFDLTVDLRVWSDGGAGRPVPFTAFEGFLGVALLE